MIKLNSQNSLDITDCPVRNVLDRIGDKWSVLIIIFLSNTGTMRFNNLQKAIPDISQKMLTVTLRTLEADGIISREAYNEIPPRVEYRLTALGESLLPAIQMLAEWALANMPAIVKNRAGYSRP